MRLEKFCRKIKVETPNRPDDFIIRDGIEYALLDVELVKNRAGEIVHSCTYRVSLRVSRRLATNLAEELDR